VIKRTAAKHSLSERAAQFFAHVNCLKKMSKNLSFVKNQLIAHFLQPKKMGKNLSSVFTAFKISQVPKTLGFSHNEKIFAALQHFPHLICTNSVKT
jgi:hypothetical protein